MILIGQYDSPFVRRVAVTLASYEIAFEHRPWSVWGDAHRLTRVNPLMRVPSLIMDDGTCLVETLVILDVLDDLVGPDRALLPRSGPIHRDGLRLCALFGGIADKAVSLLYEGLFREVQSSRWMERCQVQVTGGLDTLEAELAQRDTPYFLGDAHSHPDIACSCTLRFIQDAHPALLSARRWPTLCALMERLEQGELFHAHYQPIRNVLASAPDT